jgi:hypothetical protein
MVIIVSGGRWQKAIFGFYRHSRENCFAIENENVSF